MGQQRQTVKSADFQMFIPPTIPDICRHTKRHQVRKRKKIKTKNNINQLEIAQVDMDLTTFLCCYMSCNEPTSPASNHSTYTYWNTVPVGKQCFSLQRAHRNAESFTGDKIETFWLSLVKAKWGNTWGKMMFVLTTGKRDFYFNHSESPRLK